MMPIRQIRIYNIGCVIVYVTLEQVSSLYTSVENWAYVQVPVAIYPLKWEVPVGTKRTCPSSLVQKLTFFYRRDIAQFSLAWQPWVDNHHIHQQRKGMRPKDRRDSFITLKSRFFQLIYENSLFSCFWSLVCKVTMWLITHGNFNMVCVAFCMPYCLLYRNGGSLFLSFRLILEHICFYFNFFLEIM